MSADKKPGTFMSPDEWTVTAHVRRELIAKVGHYDWSKMTVEECDELVRSEAKRRAETGVGA